MSDSSERQAAKTVLIVIFIAGAVLLAGERTFAWYRARKAEAKDRMETRQLLKSVERAMLFYRTVFGDWPRPSSDLAWLYASRYNPRIKTDVWDRPMIFRYPAPAGPGNSRYGFDLYSTGPDGVDEGGVGDDIVVSPYVESP